MNAPNETLCAMAITRTAPYKTTETVMLLRQMGSATAVLTQCLDGATVFKNTFWGKSETRKNLERAYAWAQQEWRFNNENGIDTLCLGQQNYPQRLNECNDAPPVLYYKGRANLNAMRVVSVVGTRHATLYGQDMVRRLLTDLQPLCTDLLVVSGLAYGIDICAHRQALAQGLPTVAVLAHGMDTVYPAAHRDTALQMLEKGGWLSEFPTHTKPEKMNFVRRNRIVAGMCDATIVIESAEKGGALITAEMALGYNKEVLAVPGRANDVYSVGCNRLIQNNKATMVTDAREVIQTLGWQIDEERTKAGNRGIERELFPLLDAEETCIVTALQGHDALNVNTLCQKTGMAMGQLCAKLFALEMKGVVKPVAGGAYHLLT